MPMVAQERLKVSTLLGSLRHIKRESKQLQEQQEVIMTGIRALLDKALEQSEGGIPKEKERDI